MSLQTDLENLIRESYALIREYEAILQTSDRPTERLRTWRDMMAQRALLEGYLYDHRAISGVLPDTLAAIAARIAAPPPEPPDLDTLISPPAGDQVQGDKVLGDKVMGDKITYQVAAAPHLPLQRPPRADHFTDRRAELDQLLADLQPGQVVTLCGPGGIGKTALAAEAIWMLAPGSDPPDRFPDGIITHNFYNQPQAALALEAIARAYGEEPRPTPRDAAQRALAGRMALLLLDGTEVVADLDSVLEIRGRCGVLVTSRQRKQAVSARCDITPLLVDEAVQLAGRYLAEQEENAAIYLKWLEQTPLAALDHGQRWLESVRVRNGARWSGAL